MYGSGVELVIHMEYGEVYMWVTHGHDIEHDGVDQRGHTHTNGPPSDSESITLGSQITGEDLSGNQKGNSTPCGSISSSMLA